MFKMKGSKKRNPQPKINEVVVSRSISTILKETFISHRTEIIIFSASLALSSLILFSGKHHPYPPGISDAEYYVIAGENIARIIKSFPEFLMRFLTNSYSLMDYARMGFVDPSGVNTIFRAPSYNFYLGFLILIFGKSAIVMRISQMILLAILFVLIYRAALRLTSQTSAVITILLAMAYTPFHLVSVKADTELFLCIFILICFNLFLDLYKSPTPRKALLFGLIIMIICSVKSSMLYFFIFESVLLFFVLVSRHKNRFKSCYGSFLVGILIPLAIVTASYSRTNGKVGMSETGLAGRNLYDGQRFASDCHYAHIYCVEKWYIDEAKKITKFDPRRWFVTHSEICTLAFKKIFIHDFSRVTIYALKKSYFMLFYPHNTNPFDSAFWQKIQSSHLIIFHWALLTAAVIGFATARNQFPFQIFFCALFVYHLGIYSLSNPDNRYFFPLIPFFFLFTGLLLEKIHSFRPNRDMFVCLGLFTAVTIISICRWPLGLSDYFNFLVGKLLLVNILFILFLCILLGRVLKTYDTGHKLLTFLISIYLLCCLNVVLATNKTMLATSITTKNIISQNIVLDENTKISGYEKFYLMFDTGMNTEGWNFSVNGHSVTGTVINSQSPIFYNKDKTWRDDSPRWSFIELPNNFIQMNNTITIENPSDIIMNADYLSQKLKYLPSYIYHLAGVPHIYGFKKNVVREKRVYIPTELKSISNTTVIDKPLLNKRARIYILGKANGNYYISAKYSQLSDVYAAYVVFLQLYERGVIKYKLQPQGDDQLLKGSLIDAVGSYGPGSFYTGFDLF